LTEKSNPVNFNEDTFSGKKGLSITQILGLSNLIYLKDYFEQH